MPQEAFDSMLESVMTSLRARLSNVNDHAELLRMIVNAPFEHQLFMTSLDLGIIVLLRAHEADGMIDRVALSSTALAEGAVRASAKPFHEIRIPMDEQDNIIAKAIRDDTSYATQDWFYLFKPALTAHQARRNQMGASIECSIVYPLHSTPPGAMIYSFYQPEHNLDSQHNKFLLAYTELVSEQLRRFS